MCVKKKIHKTGELENFVFFFFLIVISGTAGLILTINIVPSIPFFLKIICFANLQAELKSS